MLTVKSLLPSALSLTRARMAWSTRKQPREFDGPSDNNATIIEIWHRRARYRWHLRRLMGREPRLLADIGLSLEEAKREIQRPFWRRCSVPGKAGFLLNHGHLDGKRCEHEGGKRWGSPSFAGLFEATKRRDRLISLFDHPNVL